MDFKEFQRYEKDKFQIMFELFLNDKDEGIKLEILCKFKS